MLYRHINACHFPFILRYVRLIIFSHKALRYWCVKGDIYLCIFSLDISHNIIHALRPYSFLCCQWMEKLHISANRLTYLERHTMTNICRLLVISVVGNPLGQIRMRVFFGLNSITNLNISRMGIIYISDDALIWRSEETDAFIACLEWYPNNKPVYF